MLVCRLYVSKLQGSSKESATVSSSALAERNFFFFVLPVDIIITLLGFSMEYCFNGTCFLLLLLLLWLLLLLEYEEFVVVLGEVEDEEELDDIDEMGLRM